MKNFWIITELFKNDWLFTWLVIDYVSEEYSVSDGNCHQNLCKTGLRAYRLWIFVRDSIHISLYLQTHIYMYVIL